jgi:hypothetical protein
MAPGAAESPHSLFVKAASSSSGTSSSGVRRAACWTRCLRCVRLSSQPKPDACHDVDRRLFQPLCPSVPPGCPVSQEERERWLAAQQQGQQQHSTGSAATPSPSPSPSSCPASEDARHAARINMPIVPNAAGVQEQATALSTARAASTIPIADPAAVPAHQQAAAAGGSGESVWMYPSEQQFYNAMARKVRDAPGQVHAEQLPRVP